MSKIKKYSIQLNKNSSLTTKWFLLQSIILSEINDEVEREKAALDLDKAYINAGSGESSLIKELYTLIPIYKKPIEKGIRWLQGNYLEATNFLNHCLKKEQEP